ncbi:MAG TPA: helical backbone metal receptor [Flavobacterium sp.]|jgi:ABC-type Fe3+-hydroxamate transport system substrate-binding protein
MASILTDQTHSDVVFSTIPQRIVSVVPSQTELLCDLGLEEKLVGITKFCVHPGHLKKEKQIVGGTKKVKYEKIIGLKPDIIIANKEENTLEMVTALRKIAPVWVTDIASVEDNSRMISDFGKIFNCNDKAHNLIQDIDSALVNFTKLIRDKPLHKALYLIWKNPYMAAGGSTYINEILKLNRFSNICGSVTRYPEIDLQQLVKDYEPGVILLSSEPYPFKEKDADEIRKFATKSKVILVDGEMFSWHGSRLLKAISYFAALELDFRT